MTTKKRPPGAGTVAKMRDRFQARVTLATGARKSLGTFATRELADEVLHAALEQLAMTDLASVGGLTLALFGRQWLDERELSGDVRDSDNERRRAELHILTTPLGAMLLRSITAVDVAAWHRTLRAKIAAGPRGGKKLSRKTRADVVRLLKQMLRHAASPEGGALIPSSPAEWLRVKPELRTVEPWDYLRTTEIASVREASIDDADRWIILFAVGTGLRLGEQMNLELTDLVVDGEAPQVVVRYGSKGMPPKNGRIRRVPLFGLGLEAARAWLALLPTYAPHNPAKLVFPTRTGARRQVGKHLHASRWDREKKRQIKVDRFKEILAATGIARAIRWHDLRHTCASMLVSGGWGRRWSLEETRELMGHTSTTSTQRYAHLAESALRRAAAETHAARPPVKHPVSLAGGGSPIGCALAATEVVSVSETACFQVVGRQGLEPWTYGLKALLGAEAGANVAEGRSRGAVDPVEVLRAVAAGDAERARAGGRELALEVLGSELVRAAVEVLEGGDFIDSRIVALCEALLSREVAAAKRGAA